MKNKLYKFIAWLEIVAGIFFGIAAIRPDYVIGRGYLGLHYIIASTILVLQSLWLFSSGILLLKNRKAGKAMSVVTGVIFVLFYIIPALISVTSYPSQSEDDALKKAIAGLPHVTDVEVNRFKPFLSGENSYGIRVHCELDVFDDDTRASEIVSQSKELIMQIAPRAKSFSEVGIYLVTEDPAHKGSEWIKRVVLKYDKSMGNYKEIYSELKKRP